jgi:hypothetical protein
LFYLRDRSGKSARISERLKSRESDSEFEPIPEVELPAEAKADDSAAPTEDKAEAKADDSAAPADKA